MENKFDISSLAPSQIAAMLEGRIEMTAKDLALEETYPADMPEVNEFKGELQSELDEENRIENEN